MHDAPSRHLNMLLVEEKPLLRKTVSMTARSLGLGTVHEAATVQAAERMLRERAFQGAVIAIDCGVQNGCHYNLELLDKVRNGMSASDASTLNSSVSMMPTTITGYVFLNAKGDVVEVRGDFSSSESLHKVERALSRI